MVIFIMRSDYYDRHEGKTILRKVQGILDLEKKFKKEALEYAAEMCLEFDCMNRDKVQRFARGYKEKKEEITEAPQRQLEFICLQGGLSD